MRKTLATLLAAGALASGAMAEDDASVYTVSATETTPQYETVTLDLSMGDKETCNYIRGEDRVLDQVVFDFNNYMSGKVMSTPRNGSMRESIQARLFNLRDDVEGINRNCYEIMAEAFEINYNVN